MEKTTLKHPLSVLRDLVIAAAPKHLESDISAVFGAAGSSNRLEAPPEADSLPDGKACGDCVYHAPHRGVMGGCARDQLSFAPHRSTATVCTWKPSQFQEITTPNATRLYLEDSYR